MANVLKLVNGIARMVGLVTGDIYEGTQIVPGGGYSINDLVTLPDSGTYESKDLEVHLAGQFLEVDINYEYVGSVTRTQIKLLMDIAEGLRLQFRVEGDPTVIYDDVWVVPSGGYTTGDPIDVPNSGSFYGKEMKIYINGQFAEALYDYNAVGSAPYTQISVLADLFAKERVRFRKIS